MKGGWVKPTCCSMVVNTLQALFTLLSIMGDKQDANAFWLPQQFRHTLNTDFFAIKDTDHFYDFVNNTLGT